jgi:hypothetical protein
LALARHLRCCLLHSSRVQGERREGSLTCFFEHVAAVDKLFIGWGGLHQITEIVVVFIAAASACLSRACFRSARQVEAATGSQARNVFVPTAPRVVWVEGISRLMVIGLWISFFS